MCAAKLSLMMQSEAILEELADQTQEVGEFSGATFELLEDYWAIADARLSAFASGQMWAVAIEVVGYDPGAAQYATRVFLLGNCVKESDSYMPHASRTLFTTPHAWNKEITDNQVWGFARDQFALRWRGQRYDFALSLEELQNAGIELSRREIEGGALTPPQILRYVCEKLEHPFFFSEDALRDLLDANAIPFDLGACAESNWIEDELDGFANPPFLSIALELVLQTRDWIHPRVGLADIDEGEWEISPREAFKTLAQTIATRDVAAWNAQDSAQFNSHWRHWAEIEAENERIEASAIEAAKAVFRFYIMETMPAEVRVEFLRQLRPTLEDAPYFSNGMEIMTIKRGGDFDKGVRIFRELAGEFDVILAILQHNNENEVANL